MSTTKAKIVVVATLLGATAVVACGSGSGPVIELGSPYENHPGDFAKPGVSNQDPSPAAKASSGAAAATDDTDGGKNTSGGTSGGTSGTTKVDSGTSGGTSGTTGSCPPCDATVSCDITVSGGKAQRMSVPLVTKNGACVLVSSGGDVTFACGGALMSGGNSVGTWANCTKATTTTPPTTPDAG